MERKGKKRKKEVNIVNWLNNVNEGRRERGDGNKRREVHNGKGREKRRIWSGEKI